LHRALLVSALLLLARGAFAAEAAAEAETFDILEYRVLGNTVLEPILLERLLYPRLGSGKTLDDVQAARADLERLYRDQGFGAVYVDIPEQTVDAGILRLQVTEGQLGRVRLSGARYFSAGRIRAELPSLQHEGALHLPTFQKELAAVNQMSRDRVVTPVLKAGAQPGAVDVELKVEDSLPLHGSVEVNNRYTGNTTETRTSLGLSYDNLFQKFHSLSFTWQASPERFRDSRVLALTYMAPLASGDSLVFYVVDTNSDFAVIANDLSVLGQGRIYGSRLAKRLPSRPGFTQGLSLGVDVKDFTDNIRLPDDIEDSTPISYAVWSAAWSGGLDAGAVTTAFSLGANAGIGGVFNQTSEFAFKRYKARPSFLYLRGDVSHERPLAGGATVHARIAGQWAQSPLISNEQFGIGGADSVRGYLESAQLGDRGVLGSFELRSASLGGLVGLPQSRLVVYGFYDIGTVAVLQFIKSTEENGQTVNVAIASQGFKLSSTGAGIRFTGRGGMHAALDWAYPLEKSAATTRGDARLHFRLSYGF
jgi:hemolysin activation/secretion protein